MLSKYPDLLIVMAAEKVNLLLTSSKEKFSYDLNVIISTITILESLWYSYSYVVSLIS